MGEDLGEPEGRVRALGTWEQWEGGAWKSRTGGQAGEAESNLLCSRATGSSVGTYHISG